MPLRRLRRAEGLLGGGGGGGLGLAERVEPRASAHGLGRGRVGLDGLDLAARAGRADGGRGRGERARLGGVAGAVGLLVRVLGHGAGCLAAQRCGMGRCEAVFADDEPR